MTSIERFVYELRRLSSGERSLLRQSAGAPLSHNVAAFDLFTSIYWRLDRRGLDKQWLWIAMTLYPWNSLPEGKGCFGTAWGKARPRDAQGRRRHDLRLDVILSAEPPALDTLLLDAMRILKCRKVAIEWEQFICDLHEWSNVPTGVRQRWARNYIQGDANG